MRVIVTGGAESVGLHAVCTHIDAGNTVLVLVNLSIGHEVNLNSPAESVLLDIRDRETVPSLFDRFRSQLVNRHAAQVNIRRSVVDPLFDSEVNAIDTISPLCEAVGAEAMFGFAGRVSLEEGL